MMRYCLWRSRSTGTPLIKNEGTDAYGNVVPMAWYCVVDPGFIANVEVHCTDSDEADYWYEEFQNDAFWIENARGIYGEG